jgi:hypothetical protein
VLQGEGSKELAVTFRIDRGCSPIYHQSIRHEGDVRNAEGADQSRAGFTLFADIGIVEIVLFFLYKLLFSKCEYAIKNRDYQLINSCE